MSLWKHTRPPKEGEPDRKSKLKLMYCAYCVAPQAYVTEVSTNFRRHLTRQHDIEVECENTAADDIVLAFERLYGQAAKIGREGELQEACLSHAIDQEAVNEALVSLIVIRNLSYRAVEWRELHHLVMAFNKSSVRYLPRSHSTMGELIKQSFLSSQELVRSKLQSAISKIHISLDIWTSPNNLLLLGVSCQFIPVRTHAVQRALLGLRPVINHSGKEQWHTLLPILQDYGIVKQIGAVMGDNSSTNDTLCRQISSYMDGEGVEWDPVANRLRCLGHIINLAVQSFLFSKIIDEETLQERGEKEEEHEEKATRQQAKFRLLGPLGKLHNIVVHTRGSSPRSRRFHELANRMIPLDNRTRWNSWFYMLQASLQQQAAIDTYTKEHLHQLSEDYLLPTDWDVLRRLKEFLHPFEQATRENQGQYARLDQVLETMDALFRHLQNKMVRYYFHHASLRIAILLDLSFYFYFSC
jgi:hypothetical protein